MLSTDTSAVGLAAVLLVTLVGGLGWEIRGSYGHEKGASFPGAAIALAICLVSGRPDWQQASLFVAAVTAAGIAFGGCMSYAKVAGYARSVSYMNAAYGLGCLFVIGGLWGGAGGCLMGLILAGWSPWALLLLGVGIGIAQEISHFLLIKVLGLRMTPPRSENWGRSFGVVAFLAIVCLVRHERAGLVGLTYGFMGWGFGFLVGMTVQLLGVRTGQQRNWWRCMETIIGLFGGAVLAVGMLSLSKTLPLARPLPAPWTILAAYGVLWLIVVFHIQHDFRFFERAGFLSKGWWAGRTPQGLSRLTAALFVMVFTLALIAWHLWGPGSPRALNQVALLWLTGACVVLGCLFDLSREAGPRGAVNVRWNVPPYVVIVIGALLPLPPFAPPLPVIGVADFWIFGIPLAVVLTLIFGKITSSLWKEDPPYAHRRFGPGADNDVHAYVPPAKRRGDTTAAK